MNKNRLIEQLNQLVSENQNPETMDIDLMSSIDIVSKINQQDRLVSLAVEEVLVPIANAVDLIVKAFKSGGRLIYIGAGTSGRLGVLDAVECVPTFGVNDNMVVAVIAGGESAMFKAKEGIEDDKKAGIEDLKKINLSVKDVVVGIAASGRTPYVIGGLEYANQLSAKTIALSCNLDAEIADVATIAILPVVGPEVLTGSTRMKSGTAQKLVLNMLSTASMIKMGKSYKNLMVDVKATNKKLFARGTRIVMQVANVDQQTAEEALVDADMRVKLAILMLLLSVDANVAQSMLDATDGFLRKAIENTSNQCDTNE